MALPNLQFVVGVVVVAFDVVVDFVVAVVVDFVVVAIDFS